MSYEDEREVEFKLEGKIDNRGKFNLQISLYDLLDELTDEQKLNLAEVITWGPVLDEAMRRLIGMADGFSTEDWKLQLEYLTEVESKLLSGYKWGMLRELKDTARRIGSHRDLYYKMRADPTHGDFFCEWMHENNIQSPYGEFEEVEQFTAVVDDWFRVMSNDRQPKMLPRLLHIVELADEYFNNASLAVQDLLIAAIDEVKADLGLE